MRASLEAIRTATGVCLAQVEKEAWTVLELHFLSRPFLADEAREQLGLCLQHLDAKGVRDPRVLKDLSCRSIQIAYGPAPPMSHAPDQSTVARRLAVRQAPAGTPRFHQAAQSHVLLGGAAL